MQASGAASVAKVLREFVVDGIHLSRVFSSNSEPERLRFYFSSLDNDRLNETTRDWTVSLRFFLRLSLSLSLSLSILWYRTM